MPPLPSSPSLRLRASPAQLVSVAVAVAAVAALWRAGRLDTFWCDESYSAGIQALAPGRIWSLSAQDTHPPLYYLMLKGWAAFWRGVGLEPGLFGMRLPGVLCWLGMLAAVWRQVGRLAGEWAAAAATVLLAFSGAALYGATIMRQNAVAVPAMGVAWLLLVTLRFRVPEETSPRRDGALWTAYALLLAACSWGHALVIGFAGCLGVVWLVLTRRAGRSFRIGGALAHAFVLLAYLPYVPTLLSSIAFIGEFSVPWKTPATPGMLALVYTVWYPFGPLDAPGGLALVPAVALGTVSLLLPAVLALRAVRRREGAGRPEGAVLAVSGLGLGIAWPLLTWLVDRAGIAAAFHGSRHPYLALVPLVVGLVSLCAWATERGAIRRRWAAVALAPWATYTLLGFCNVLVGGGERLGELRDVAISAFVPPGQPLFVVPGGVAPLLDREFAANPLLPLEALSATPLSAHLHVVEFHGWPKLHTPAEQAMMERLRRAESGTESLGTPFPEGNPEVTFFRLPAGEAEPPRE